MMLALDPFEQFHLDYFCYFDQLTPKLTPLDKKPIDQCPRGVML